MHHRFPKVEIISFKIEEITHVCSFLGLDLCL